MKRFKFTLQRLLDLRVMQEKEIQMELAVLISEQNILRQKQDDYRRKVEEQKKLYAEKVRTGKLIFSDAMMYQRYEGFADKVIIDSQFKIDEMEPAINEVRTRLVEAQRDRKVIEKLKVKKLAMYNYETNREIVKENDDINQKMLQRRIAEDAMESVI